MTWFAESHCEGPRQEPDEDQEEPGQQRRSEAALQAGRANRREVGWPAAVQLTLEQAEDLGVRLLRALAEALAAVQAAARKSRQRLANQRRGPRREEASVHAVRAKVDQHKNSR